MMGQDDMRRKCCDNEQLRVKDFKSFFTQEELSQDHNNVHDDFDTTCYHIHKYQEVTPFMKDEMILSLSPNDTEGFL